jgi:hypothetical protein
MRGLNLFGLSSPKNEPTGSGTPADDTAGSPIYDGRLTSDTAGSPIYGRSPLATDGPYRGHLDFDGDDRGVPLFVRAGITAPDRADEPKDDRPMLWAGAAVIGGLCPEIKDRRDLDERTVRDPTNVPPYYV